MRGALILLLAAGVARAETAAVAKDPPRWRLRGALTAGFGGTRDRDTSHMVFPLTLEFGVRLWGPLSLAVAGQGVLMGGAYEACGELQRANAALGTAGLRLDFGNGKSASWLVPFVEAHGGVGGQDGGRPQGGECPAPGVFGTGGVRLGLDAWLGRVAVTVAAAFDYLPNAPPISVAIGATVALY
jgi:hypothetical protein